MKPVSIKENPRINDWLRRVESEMRNTLAQMLAESIKEYQTLAASVPPDPAAYMAWLDRFPTQVTGLSAQIAWSEEVEGALNGGTAPTATLASVNATLEALADSVLQEQPPVRRKKLEQLITEFVHKRDVTRGLVDAGIAAPKDFTWLRQMRFYWDPKEPDVLKRLTIAMANARFFYGFEYLGVQEKLVQTPLTDRSLLLLPSSKRKMGLAGAT